VGDLPSLFDSTNNQERKNEESDSTEGTDYADDNIFSRLGARGTTRSTVVTRHRITIGIRRIGTHRINLERRVDVFGNGTGWERLIVERRGFSDDHVLEIGHYVVGNVTHPSGKQEPSVGRTVIGVRFEDLQAECLDLVGWEI